MKHLLATALAAALMGLAGCGGGGEGGVSNDPGSPAGPPVAGGPTPAPLPPPAQPDPVPPFELGGLVTGLAGTVTLLSDLGDRLDVGANGPYAFPARYGPGQPYRVEIERQPSGQRCTVQADGGVFQVAPVRSVGVTCQATTPEQPAADVPAAPSQIGIAYGTKSYTLTWTAVPGATSYRVGRDADGDGPAGATEDTTVQTLATRASIFVPDEARAAIYLRACNAAGCSVRSRTIQPSPLQMIGEFKPPASAETEQFFGHRVAISATGDVLAVMQGWGADRGVHIYVKANGRWTFERLFQPVTNSWTEGLAMSGDGRFVAVGDANALGVRGKVFVLDRDSSAVSELVAAVADGGDGFGISVSLSTDGSVLVVGAPGEDAPGTDPRVNGASRSGAAYIFVRNGATWQQQAFLKAGAPVSDAEFGNRVSIAGNGSRVAIGALGEPSSTGGINPQANSQAPYAGAVYTFVRAGDAWNLEAFIKAPNPDTNDMFSAALKLSESGDTLLVSAPGESSVATWDGGGDPADNSLLYTGAAYLYTFANNNWSLERYFKGPTARAFGVFGSAVAMDASGTVLAIAATGDPSASIGIDGNLADTQMYDAGAVHLFRKVAGAWTYSHYVKSRISQSNSNFGADVDLSRDGKTMPVGSFYGQTPDTYVGRVELY